MTAHLSRVIVKGGVLSPGELRAILEVVESVGLQTIAFGSRQDILFLKDVDKERFASENLRL